MSPSSYEWVVRGTGRLADTESGDKKINFSTTKRAQNAHKKLYVSVEDIPSDRHMHIFDQVDTRAHPVLVCSYRMTRHELGEGGMGTSAGLGFHYWQTQSGDKKETQIKK